MADEEIVYSVKVEAEGGEKSLKQLRDEFKSFDNQLSTAKAGTKEFTNALKGMGEAKGKIIELKNQIDALNPEARGRAIGQISNSLAGGFQAATGAAALFGSKAEDVQKTLVKVQAATAFAQGIQEVTQLGGSFQALKLILLANPILIIGGVIAAIGTALFALRDKIAIVGDAFKVLGEAFDWVVQKTKDLLDAVGISDFAADELKKVRAERLKHMEWENAQRDAMREIAKQERLKDEEEAKKAAEKSAKALEIIRKRVRDKIKEEGVEDAKTRYDELVNTSEVNRSFREQALADEEVARNKRLANEKTVADFNVMIQTQSFQQIGQLALAFAGKSEASQKRAFEINKAAGIAQATIDTYISANKAYASQLIPGDPSSPIRAAIAAGFSIASGLARVAIIAKTKFTSSAPSGGGEGGGAPNLSNSSSPTIEPPQRTLNTTQVKTNEQGNFAGFGNRQDQRVYVVESDISKAQNKVSIIEQNAKY